MRRELAVLAVVVWKGFSFLGNILMRSQALRKSRLLVAHLLSI